MRFLLDVLIRGYQFFVSPLFGPCCRFHPTCSQYLREALVLHPLPVALWLGLRRVLRCHPWHPGGVDPVPTRLPGTFWVASAKENHRGVPAPQPAELANHGQDKWPEPAGDYALQARIPESRVQPEH